METTNPKASHSIKIKFIVPHQHITCLHKKKRERQISLKHIIKPFICTKLLSDPDKLRKPWNSRSSLPNNNLTGTHLFIHVIALISLVSTQEQLRRNREEQYLAEQEVEKYASQRLRLLPNAGRDRPQSADDSSSSPALEEIHRTKNRSDDCWEERGFFWIRLDGAFAMADWWESGRC